MRIGVVGYEHEANARARELRRSDATEHHRLPGGLTHSWIAGPLVERLSRRAEIVELPVFAFPAGGPVNDDDFETIRDEIAAATAAAGPLDALVILGHGAGTTSTGRDADGECFAALRHVAGPSTPLVAVLDLHANISSAMVSNCDALIGYRTNPHVDIHDRLVEAAETALLLAGGTRTHRTWCRLPLMLSQLAQLTTDDEPLGRAIDFAQSLVGPDILNVSVFGGFSLADSPDCGVTVVVTADEHCTTASEVVRDIAAFTWSLRREFRTSTTSVADAVELAAATSPPDAPALLLADVADNPGGGAPANTTYLLSALHERGVRGVQLGLHCDPLLVDRAFELGRGARFDAIFNNGSQDRYADPYAAPARVLALTDEPLQPTRGVYAGASLPTGRCCALELDGLAVAVSSHPVQCADQDTLAHVGLDPTQARVVVVKSRGHFRAGFAELFGNDQIIEVGAPGVSSPDLDSTTWHRLRRPIFPLDPDIDGLDADDVIEIHTTTTGRPTR
jgi:microcystin degradation protein MlrC